MDKPRILVGILNWGLGHATRCIPILEALNKQGFEVFIASDGDALTLLKKEFPRLKTISLPSYNISYSKNAFFLKWKLLAKSPQILNTIKKEKKLVEKLVRQYKFSGIISDNRWGCRHPEIKSVFITHQYNVLSGLTTYFSSKLHQKYISKFDECWIPDTPKTPNLSGKMGHLKVRSNHIKYIGALSRFQKKNLKKKYDLAVILSGPEPQRSLLEEKLLSQLRHSNKKIVFVRGKINSPEVAAGNKQIRIENYLGSKALEKVMLESEFIICRSGYSSIMDLAKLEKKALLIPTPGQFEQEYLARRLMEQGIAPSRTQKDFEISKLKELDVYSGFQDLGYRVDFGELFALFKGK